MFCLFRKNVVLLVFILLLGACGASSSINGEFDPSETLFLDDSYEYNSSVDIADVIALDVPVPASKGYVLIGASFDPAMLRLDHYLEYEDDGTTRVRYIFTTLAVGSSDILIKMEKTSGGEPEVYKQVRVAVARNEGLF